MTQKENHKAWVARNREHLKEYRRRRRKKRESEEEVRRRFNVPAGRTLRSNMTCQTKP